MADFLIGLAFLVVADLYGDFPVEPLEKIQNLVGGEPAEMPVHQVRGLRLLDAEQGGDFRLFQFFPFQDLINMKSYLGPGMEFFRPGKAEIGINIAGVFF